MKLRARSVAWLLPFTLTACIHFGHKKQVQPPPPPPIEATPKVDTKIEEHPPVVETNTTQPVSPAPTQPPPAPAQNTHKVTPKPKPSPSKRIQPATNNNVQAANNTALSSASTLQASNESPAAIVVGPLTSGENPDLRKETVELIASIEKGLSSIDHKLSDTEQKTAAQIREYLRQAKLALNSGDVDGAHTLAEKAKLLLSELNS